jgi:uncharacterized protein YegP (UPF0339 family)
MTELKPIRSNEDYEKAMEMLAALWGAKVGTSDGDHLDILVTLIDAYENAHFPIDAPSAAAVDRVMAEDANNNDGNVGGKEPAYVFQIHKNRDGNFIFHVAAGSGEVILTSDIFGSQADAVKAIESLKENLSRSEIVEDAA